MGRAPRVEVPGAIYHVMHRGNNQEAIFRDDVDRKYFMKLIGQNKSAQGYEIYGFVLMDNHYHLLLRTYDQSLSKVMQRLNNSNSKYFNAKHDRVGHVFQGRYRSKHIADEEYLLIVLRYIHYNPVKAGLCRAASDYQWSSDWRYRNGYSGLVDTGFVLNILGQSRDQARIAYARLMLRDAATGYDCDATASPNQLWQHYRKDKLEELLHTIVQDNQDRDLIKQGSRLHRLRPLKTAYIRAAHRQGFSYREIGRSINLSYVAVARLLKLSSQT